MNTNPSSPDVQVGEQEQAPTRPVHALPRVSIGLPVYNGQNFLVEALDSLLAQTFTDFELIISDNASTDRTQEICRAYTARDPRIQYIRQPVNMGGAPNQNFLLTQARAPLFKWAAHDDLYGPDLLERCVEILDREPHVVLCHADMAIIDAKGAVVEVYDYTMPTDSPRPSERFRALLYTDGGDDEYGVVRTDVLRSVRPIDSYYQPGRPFVAEIALHGPFRQARELMYFRRDHPDRGDRTPSVSGLSAKLDPRRARHSPVRLQAEYLWAYVGVVFRSPISGTEKIRCFRYLAGWMVHRLGTRPRHAADSASPSGLSHPPTT
jgi:glycosyltransferase involved in cell wall biosynthesis